jgi:hypothetical protein
VADVLEALSGASSAPVLALQDAAQIIKEQLGADLVRRARGRAGGDAAPRRGARRP